MKVWGSQSIQFVWFIASVDDARASVLYERLVREEPDSMQQNRVSVPGNPFLSVASGQVGESEYKFQIQPGRIDLLLSPKQDLESPQSTMSLLDTQLEIKRVLNFFSNVNDGWPLSVRLSVVANLCEMQATEEKSTETFLNLTGIEMKGEDLSDLVLQVNRRKPFRDYPLLMNRLMRFGTAVYQKFQIQTDDAFGPNRAVPVSVQECATTLVLDFNSVPDGRVFEFGDQVSIFNELADELLRIASSRSPKALEQ